MNCVLAVFTYLVSTCLSQRPVSHLVNSLEGCVCAQSIDAWPSALPSTKSLHFNENISSSVMFDLLLYRRLYSAADQLTWNKLLTLVQKKILNKRPWQTLYLCYFLIFDPLYEYDMAAEKGVLFNFILPQYLAWYTHWRRQVSFVNLIILTQNVCTYMPSMQNITNIICVGGSFLW